MELLKKKHLSETLNLGFLLKRDLKIGVQLMGSFYVSV